MIFSSRRHGVQKGKILPLDEMIKYANLKIMHSYTHNKLPLSFNNRVLRNANDLFVPAHHFATVSRRDFLVYFLHLGMMKIKENSHRTLFCFVLQTI